MTEHQTKRRLLEIDKFTKAWKHSFDVAMRREDPQMAADALQELLKLAHEFERLTGKSLPSVDGAARVIRNLRESGVH